MIQAELHGKAPRSARASEDMLTSTVWERLRYLPLEFLAAVLREVVPWNLPDDPIPAAPCPWGSLSGAEIVFWPKARRAEGGYDECDLLLLLDGPGGLRSSLLVEAKYGAPKSQREVEDQSDTRATGDQLARYLIALHEGRFLRAQAPVQPLGIVYLTAHPAPPRVALDESLSEARRAAAARGLPAPWVGWLGWADLEHALRATPCPATAEAGTLQERVREDLLDLLGERNLFAYHGLTAPAPLPSLFRSQAARFSAPPPLPAPWRRSPA